VWRILTHERNRASLEEIEKHWSLVDIVDAHLALDLHDELQRLAYERSKNP
jgi:hypothetical protein